MLLGVANCDDGDDDDDDNNYDTDTELKHSFTLLFSLQILTVSAFIFI